MSATKRDSPGGCGEQLADYEEWLDGLPPLTEADIEAMAAQDAERRREEVYADA